MNKEKLTLAHTQLKKHRTSKFFHTGSSGKSKKLPKNIIKRDLFLPINFIYFTVHNVKTCCVLRNTLQIIRIHRSNLPQLGLVIYLLKHATNTTGIKGLVPAENAGL
jgi:hypothetical protein